MTELNRRHVKLNLAIPAAGSFQTVDRVRFTVVHKPIPAGGTRVYWDAGIFARRIEVTGPGEHGQPVAGKPVRYLVAGTHSENFVRAALRAIFIRQDEVRKARELIAAYDAASRKPIGELVAEDEAHNAAKAAGGNLGAVFAS